MTRIFNDIRSGLRSFFASYLTLYLPASILIIAFSYAALSQADIKALAPAFFLSFILFTCLPPVAAARGLQNAGHRLKSFSLIGGDALMAALLLYLLPRPGLQTAASLGLVALIGSAAFILICFLIKRGLHVTLAVDRQGPAETIRLIWKKSPGLLFRMGAGVLFSILSLGIAHLIMNALPFADESQRLTAGLVLSSAVVIPASFMPFILLAEGLKPAVPDPSPDKE